MSHFKHIVTLLTCAVLVTDVVVGYKYYAKANGWIAKQPIIATWDEALQQCRAEGAVLMSPSTEGRLSIMKSLINDREIDHIYYHRPYGEPTEPANTTYYIGTRSMLHPRLFVSVEGISLADMPITYLMEPFEPEVDLCLAMDHDKVFTVSCTLQLPFFCYKKRNSRLNLSECGTFDQGYKLNNVTGSCYKYHNVNRAWNDAYWICVTEGGYLAILNDEQEAKEIVKLTSHQGNYVHIGLRAWKGSGDWMSVHRHPLRDIFNKFENGNPSGSCCKVGSIHPSESKLEVMVDSDERHFICEKDPDHIRYSGGSENNRIPENRPFPFYQWE